MHWTTGRGADASRNWQSVQLRWAKHIRTKPGAWPASCASAAPSAVGSAAAVACARGLNALGAPSLLASDQAASVWAFIERVCNLLIRIQSLQRQRLSFGLPSIDGRRDDAQRKHHLHIVVVEKITSPWPTWHRHTKQFESSRPQRVPAFFQGRYLTQRKHRYSCLAPKASLLKTIYDKRSCFDQSVK